MRRHGGGVSFVRPTTVAAWRENEIKKTYVLTAPAAPADKPKRGRKPKAEVTTTESVDK